MLLLLCTGFLHSQEGFFISPVTGDIYARILGKSYKQGALIGLEELRYVQVLHVDFEGKTRKGELICNRSVADDLMSVFMELYEARYPIERICLVDEYGADDELSMENNNSSCFNYRVINGTNRLSNHGKGMAMDINPLYNPCVRKRKDGSVLVEPAAGKPYADRSGDSPYMIKKDDLCCRIFEKYGFEWGGDWTNPKDYQHFEKVTH